MRRISIRELHLDTGRWVRQAAELGVVIITDHGRPIAALVQPEQIPQGRLPDREAIIRSRGRITVDSAVLISEDRDKR